MPWVRGFGPAKGPRTKPAGWLRCLLCSVCDLAAYTGAKGHGFIRAASSRTSIIPALALRERVARSAGPGEGFVRLCRDVLLERLVQETPQRRVSTHLPVRRLFAASAITRSERVLSALILRAFLLARAVRSDARLPPARIPKSQAPEIRVYASPATSRPAYRPAAESATPKDRRVSEVRDSALPALRFLVWGPVRSRRVSVMRDSATRLP